MRAYRDLMTGAMDPGDDRIARSVFAFAAGTRVRNCQDPDAERHRITRQLE